MKFNSLICTSKSQSERLLKLGLKKETADMTIHIKDDGGWYVTAEPFYEWEDDINTLPSLEEPEQILPAWSLHRLMCLVFNSGVTCVELYEDDDAYETLIYNIEWRTKEGYFNKEYLEEEK